MGEYITDSYGNYGRCVAEDRGGISRLIYDDRPVKDRTVEIYGSIKILPKELWTTCREKSARCSDCEDRCHVKASQHLFEGEPL